MLFKSKKQREAEKLADAFMDGQKAIADFWYHLEDNYSDRLDQMAIAWHERWYLQYFPNMDSFYSYIEGAPNEQTEHSKWVTDLVQQKFFHLVDKFKDQTMNQLLAQPLVLAYQKIGEEQIDWDPIVVPLAMRMYYVDGDPNKIKFGSA